MYSADPIKKEICLVGKRLYEKNLVIANDGNISLRTCGNRVLITPTRICKGDMTPDMIFKIDMEGNIIEGSGNVTTEVHMHLPVLRTNPQVKAVVHAHPQYATTLAVANIALDKIIFPTGFSFLGHVPIVPYATSTTVELGDSIRKFIEDGQNALILGNHGALTCGETLWDAYYLMERLENYAQITYMSKLIGGGRELTDDEKIRLQAKIDRQKKAGLL